MVILNQERAVMPEYTKTLELLHDIEHSHSLIKEFTSRLDRGKRKIVVARKKLAEMTVLVEKAKESRNAILLEIHEKESLIAAGDAMITKRKSQLLEAKNNKEYQSLQEQIGVDQLNNNKLSDETLQLMEELEGAEEDLAGATTLMETAEANLQTAVTDVETQTPKIQANIEQYRERLRSYVEKLPREFRPLYEQADRNYPLDSLASLSQGVYCGYCQQQIPTQFVTKILSGNPYICQNCSRLVYRAPGTSLTDEG